MTARRATALLFGLVVSACSSAPTTPTSTPALPTATLAATQTAQPSSTVPNAPGETAATSASPTAESSASPSASSLPSSSSALATPSAPTSAGPIQSVAGGGATAPANGLPITSVALLRPLAIAFALDGTYWMVDANAGLLLHVLADGTLADVTSGFANPSGVTVTTDGKVYIGDRGNYRIDVYNGHGGFDVAAGDAHFPGASGDGRAFGKAQFAQPTQIVSDDSGNLYINDLGNEKIRWVNAQTDVIDRIAGNGTTGFSGDGGPARDAQISSPLSLVVDAGRTELLIGDAANQRLRRVDLASGKIASIAGNGGQAGNYDPLLTGGQTAMTRLSALALDNAGNVYLPVFWGNMGVTIERMDASGHLTLIAGGGGTAAAAGVAPLDVGIDDVLCLAINPTNGDLLWCSPSGHVFSVPSVATVAGP